MVSRSLPYMVGGVVPPGIYPPSAPQAVLAATPWEATKFIVELYHQGCVQVAPIPFDLARAPLNLQLVGAVFSVWFVDADLMTTSHIWLNTVANTLIVSGGLIITFDRNKLRAADNL